MSLFQHDTEHFRHTLIHLTAEYQLNARSYVESVDCVSYDLHFH